ncbi:thiamine pyrophosphate-binding protein [Microbacterium sp. zg.Y625]|uniref:thiamine pyrophosphate-binding protein n=1 Tax=Microbacterium jiangjiandongii TaxID=3049071 RepID=UPI00214CBBF3|nr:MULTISPECIES: thiamine pyrophosphate-binding protein [unclassified Microbacterium]MCR2793483.1 thiamine pyrophosphate-binding protein [Microbacterium sp. zg.Y625]MCR2815339.1 thiamine pyrophosphate-binding protein [Microbacterium sp. zg.Y843]WIM25150.1 thiamine pyrophosphate-binding protein [Microbacterium sp. zg-Y625]
MEVHDAVAATLREHGVSTVFGLVGDANVYMMESFRRRGGVFVPVAHEGSALLAALGHAAVTGGVGVASVTQGPGLANTIHSLYEAVKRRAPTVLIVGDTPRADSDNFQDIDQAAVVTATGALFHPVRTPDSAARDLAAAMHLAVSRRLPVVFDVPAEFQWAATAGHVAEALAVETGVVVPAAAALEQAVGALASARRPVVLAGRGAVQARDEVLDLAKAIGAPVATTVQARQLFRGHPLDLGIFGGLSRAATAEILAEADAVVAVGASLNRWTTAHGSLLHGRVLVQIDSDPVALGRHLIPTVAVHGDSAATTRALTALWRQADLPASSLAGAPMRERLASARVAHEETRRLAKERELARERSGDRPPGTLDLGVAMDLVEQGFPAERTLVIDAGRQCVTALGVLTVPHPRDYVHTIHFGSIGVGVPYAIGAAVASAGRPTLLACGDGGFMLGGVNEFRMAVAQQLDLLVVVFNDGSFGAEHVLMVRKGLDPSLSLFDWPDLGALAEVLGGRGRTVRTVAELEAALDAARGWRGPGLINVLLDAAEISADPQRNP